MRDHHEYKKPLASETTRYQHNPSPSSHSASSDMPIRSQQVRPNQSDSNRMQESSVTSTFAVHSSSVFPSTYDTHRQKTSNTSKRTRDSFEKLSSKVSIDADPFETMIVDQ
jgi:hypothetical protein